MTFCTDKVRYFYMWDKYEKNYNHGILLDDISLIVKLRYYLGIYLYRV